jgi:enamine deaminase RidA (YjgF/YER057c/UK114 family)
VTEGRRRVSSGGPFEGRYGYSRAVVVGDSVWVAGTTDPDGVAHADAAVQARAAFAVVERALVEAGFALSDTVRTRMYVTRAADAHAVAAVHGELFGAIRPAATLVVVSALLEPEMLVEVELEARRG